MNLLYKIESGILTIGTTVLALNLIIPEFTIKIQLDKRFFVICGSLAVGYHLITNL
jgi:hypothetical protein